MSRKIDVSNPDSLSKEDRAYLQERGRLPKGVDPVYSPELVQMAIAPNTGTVTDDAPVGGSSIEPPKTGPAPEPSVSSYDDMTVKQLKAEVDRRNEQRDSDAELSKPSKKEDLITVLEADDDEAVFDDGGEE